MTHFVDYDLETGKFKYFYQSDRHPDIPETAIELSDDQYVQAALNQNDWKIDPTTKTLVRRYPT